MKEDITFVSYDKKTQIHGILYKIDNPKYIMQIIPGILDSIDEYEELAKHLSDDNIMICGMDNLNLGNSIDNGNYGYFGNKKEAYLNILKDIDKFYNEIHNKYPDIPYYILGYSYGALIAKLYANNNKSINGLILIGCPYKNNVFINKFNINFNILSKGEKETDYNDYKNIFNKANKYYVGNDEYAWISNNTNYINMIKNKYNPRLTFNGFYVLYDILGKASSNKYIKNTSNDLHILILSGKDDPISNYGNDVNNIKNQYQKLLVKILDSKVYNNLRHNLLQEKEKDIVINDIINFINNK